MTIISIHLEPQSVDRIQSFCGPQNLYITIIEEQLGIEISGSNFDLKVLADTQEHAELAQHVIQGLYDLTEQKGKVYYLEEKDVYNTIYEIQNLFRHNINRRAEILEQVESLKNLFAFDSNQVAEAELAIEQDLFSQLAESAENFTESAAANSEPESAQDSAPEMDQEQALLNTLLSLTSGKLVPKAEDARVEADSTSNKAAKVDYSQYQKQSVTPEADRLKHLLDKQNQGSADQNVLLESNDNGDLSLAAEVSLGKQLEAEAGIALTSNKLSADDVDNMYQQVSTTENSELESMLINGSKLNQSKESNKSKNITEHNQLTSSSLPWETEASEALYDTSGLSPSELGFFLASLKQALDSGAISDDVLEEISRYREIIAQAQLAEQDKLDSEQLPYSPKVELEISLPDDIAQMISDYEGQLAGNDNPAIDPDLLRYGVSSMLQELEQQNLTAEQELALIQKFFADLATGQLQASLTPNLDNLEAELEQLQPKRKPQDYAPNEQVKLAPEIASDIFRDFDQLFSPAPKASEPEASKPTSANLDLKGIDLFADFMAQKTAESASAENELKSTSVKEELLNSFEQELANLGLLSADASENDFIGDPSFASVLSRLEAQVQDTISFKFAQLQDQVVETLMRENSAQTLAELSSLVPDLKQELKLTITKQFATAQQQARQTQQQVRELQEQILKML